MNRNIQERRREYAPPIRGETVEDYAQRLHNMGSNHIIPYAEIRPRCKHRWKTIAADLMKRLEPVVIS